MFLSLFHKGGDIKDSVDDLRASASKTGLGEDVNEIKNLTGTEFDGMVETMSEPSSTGSPVKKAAASKVKTRR